MVIYCKLDQNLADDRCQQVFLLKNSLLLCNIYVLEIFLYCTIEHQFRLRIFDLISIDLSGKAAIALKNIRLLSDLLPVITSYSESKH